MSISIMQGVLNIPGAQHKIRAKGIEKPGFPENYTLIDVETTGLNPTYSRITEMGGLKVRRGEVVQTFSELVKFPDSNKVPAYISKLNDIDEAKIEAEGMPVDEAIKKFRFFIGSDPIVGYNVNFDLNFVYDLTAQYDLPVLSNDYVDVYRLAKSFYPTERRNRLIDCLNRLGIAQTQDHRGLQDTIDTKAVFDELHRQFKHEHLLRAHEMIKSMNLTNEWPEIVKQNYALKSPFKNKNVTIIGDWDLDTDEIAQAIHNLGGNLQDEINEESNYLLIGDNDRFRTDLKELNKAKLLKDQGQKIHLWTEKYFLNTLDNWARS